MSTYKGITYCSRFHLDFNVNLPNKRKEGSYWEPPQAEYGLRCTEYGVRSTEYGVRCTEYGVRCTEYGVRCTVYGGQEGFKGPGVQDSKGIT